MAESCVNYLHQHLFQVITFSGVLLNILLLLLVRNHTPNVMNSYRKVLYASCFFDGFSAFAHFFVMSRPSMEKDVLVMHFDGPLPQILDYFDLLPGGHLAYIIMIEAIFQMSTVCFCCVPYTYRYFHIVRKTTLNNTQFLLLLLVYLTPSTIISISLPILSAKVYPQLSSYIGQGDGPCLRRIPIFDRRIIQTEPFHSIGKICFSVVLITFTFPFVLGYFLIRIFQELSRDVQKTSRLGSRMQRQITITLTVQSVIPIIFIAFPFFYGILSLNQNGDKEGSVRLLSNSLNLIPFINPIATIVLTKSYRLTITRAVEGLRSTTSAPLVSMVSSKTSLTGNVASNV